MIAEEASKFMDSNFGQLDLSGFPDLNNQTSLSCRRDTALTE